MIAAIAAQAARPTPESRLFLDNRNAIVDAELRDFRALDDFDSLPPFRFGLHADLGMSGAD